MMDGNVIEDRSPTEDEWEASSRMYDIEKDVRNHLTQQAIARYDSILTHRGSYGQSLRALQDHLSERKQRTDPDAVPVTFIDPDKMFIGFMLGMPLDTVIQKIMQHEGRPVASVTNAKGNSSSNRMRPKKRDRSAFTADGTPMPFIIPMAYYQFRVPSYYLEAPTSLTEQRINLHEGFHYLDTTFLPTERGALYKPNSTLLLEDEKYFQDAISTQHAEGFADVGSAGELIRHGQSTDILQDLIEQREEASDLGHQTSDTIRYFEKTIQDMGVQTFRSLSDEDAIALYKNVALSGGITPEQLRLAARIKLVEYGNPDYFRFADDVDGSHPDFQKALKYSAGLNVEFADLDDDGFLDNSYATVRDPEKNVWRDRLVNRTFADHNIITTETLAFTYLKMADEVRQAHANPDIPTLLSLSQAFDFGTDLNFIAENHIRGVDLFEAGLLDITTPDFDPANLEPRTTPEKPKPHPQKQTILQKVSTFFRR